MIDGQKLSDVHAQAPDLWQYLAALPATIEAQQFIALLISGTVGIIAHYTMKWARGEIVGSLLTYLFKDHLRNTVLSFFSYVGFAITTIGSGGLMNDGSSIGWYPILVMGLTTGFAVDAIANKGQRPVWTDEQREKKVESPSTPTAVLPVTGEKQP